MGGEGEFTVDGVPDWAGRGTLILLGALAAGVLVVGLVELVSRWRLRRGEVREDYARTWWRSTLRTAELHVHSLSRGAQLLRRPWLAISSIAAGTTRRASNAETPSTAAVIAGNVASNVAAAGGFGSSRTVILVMMARVPSEPTRSCVRS